ncbi:MAG TPA: tetratricopeptide repeat protein, partial [Herpetosiphonaceae bacterium]|nr:tetratricopeptide repeat protein [Herpetosiphonaceae bacterium]
MPHVRLLTLSGPGGVGKTHLSLAVGAALRPHFSDGVVFFSLADIRDPDFVPAALVQSLGLPPLAARRALDHLIAYLQAKSILLVLDNFEHLVAAAPQVAELLAAAPGLKVLTTSRTILGLHGEHVQLVPPLPVPPQDAAPTLATVQTYPATALFVQRLWATLPDIELTPPDLAAVLAICRKLEGLPLALELAARRCRLFTVEELLDRLQRRLSVLQDTEPNTPARHQTLYATIDWSYQLLDDWVQTLFARLAVFAGSWSLDAAMAICDHHRELPVSVVDGLTILLDHSLIALVPQPDATPRYTMLETLREFAKDRLAERGEELAVRQQHLAYYLFLAEEAARHYNRADETVWLDTLEKERYNLWAAAQWTGDHGPVEDALRLGGFLGHFWTRRGSWHDALRWLTSVLAMTEETAPERIMALESTLILAGKIGDFTVIQTYAEEILRVAQALGNLPGEAVGYLYLGYAAHARGDDATAEAHLVRALVLFQETGDDAGVGRVRYQQWRLAAHHGQITVGLPFLEEAAHYSRALGNKVGLAQALNDLGAVRAEVEGRYAEARALTKEGLELFRSVRDVWGTCYALRNLGEVLMGEGELAQARQLFEESLAIA